MHLRLKAHGSVHLFEAETFILANTGSAGPRSFRPRAMLDHRFILLGHVMRLIRQSNDFRLDGQPRLKASHKLAQVGAPKVYLTGRCANISQDNISTSQHLSGGPPYGFKPISQQLRVARLSKPRFLCKGRRGMTGTTSCPTCAWIYMSQVGVQDRRQNGLYWPTPGAHTCISGITGISGTSKF